MPAQVPERIEHHDAPYLLIFESNSSWVYPLPESGEVVVGRGDLAGLQLHDGSVSRTHAKIVTSPAEARLCDVGSQNGTVVNGERVVGWRSLVSGDTITLSAVTMVFHAGARHLARPAVVDFARFRERADDEVARSQHSRRPFAIVVLQLGRAVDRGSIASAISTQLRRVDLASWDSVDRLLLLIAESDPEAAMAAATRLLGSVETLAPAARVGFASWPLDGLDVDTLLASARAATDAATSNAPARGTTSYRTLEIGDRRAVVADPAMVRMFTLLRQLAGTDLPVLLSGETGSGKDIAAAALHEWSARRGKPFIAVNCAAIPEQLVESELFGFERGAFSGAIAPKHGLVEASFGGTLFFDEVAELSLAAQAKLLRVLETKKIRALGDLRERDIDVRVVTASNRNLPQQVESGRFRSDLYFRLKGATVWIPPLRDRKSEIPILTQHFLDHASKLALRPPIEISARAMESLIRHPWPGNVRELLHFAEYVAAVATERVLEPWHLHHWLEGQAGAEGDPSVVEVLSVASPVAADPRGAPHFRVLEEEIRELERSRLREALLATGGNQTRAAALIGMPLRTFVAKVKAYNLQSGLQAGESSMPRKSTPPT